ncbi:hypothetical protein [Xanthomonas albilineans]|uniref:hypothetical protein n=1 Tax=Xanthomonas albilineans TaxID=29447 RepID=UPI0005F35C9E|nr:hypothetical protein [Xanthomonas albilineans]
MFKKESLVSLFSLLQEMTLVKRDKEVFRSPTWIRWLEKVTGYLYFGVATLFMVSALVQYKYPSEINLFLLDLFYVLLCFIGIACLLTLILSQGMFFWKNRKRGFPVEFLRLKIDILADADFLARLHCYEKAVLEYGRLQYRSHFDSLDGRFGLLVGDLRKIGIFPAFIALVMAASTLIKSNNSKYLWAPLILAAIFYLAGIFVRARQERTQQVIDLLDYAIFHSEMVTEQK